MGEVAGEVSRLQHGRDVVGFDRGSGNDVIVKPAAFVISKNENRRRPRWAGDEGIDNLRRVRRTQLNVVTGVLV